jgi:poly(A) polymerase
MKKQYFTIEYILSYWFRSFRKEVKNFFIVGGAVRDRLLSLPGGDVDLVCEDAFSVAKAVATERGAAVVPFTKKKDSPCFRVIEKRHPGLSIDISPVKGGDISLDLAARDFTVNSMALEVTGALQPGKLVDPFDGFGDLGRRLVRMTGPDAFRNDPLRVFRAFRFSAALGFDIESATLKEAHRCSGLVSGTAGERIRTELELFLSEEHISSLAGELISTGAIDPLFPGRIHMKARPTRGVKAGRTVLACVEALLEKPEKVFGPSSHIAAQILNEAPRRFLVKLAAFLLDAIGVYTIETVNDAAGCLRMPRKQSDVLRLLASGYHFLQRSGVLEDVEGEGVEWFRMMGDETLGASILAMAAAEAGGRSNVPRLRIKTAAARYLSGLRESFSHPSLVSGKDLMKLGVVSGPAVGEVLTHVRNAQDRGEVSSREEALRLAREIYLRRPPETI